MQVEPVPAPPTVLPEASVPSLPVVGTEPMENTTESLPVTEEAEQPTFHVMQPPVPAPAAPSEPAAAPPATTYAQLIAVPIASDQSAVSTAPTPPVKQTKRGSRPSQSHKQMHRSPGKPATLLARPSTGKTSTILPQPPKAVVLGNQMAPLVPKPVATNGQMTKPAAVGSSAGFTTYLVVDGNQGQLVQVANDGQKPVTFRNQAGQILQATPITVVSAANQPTAPSFPTTGEANLVANAPQMNGFLQQQTSMTSLATQQSHQNSSQMVTTVRTSSSIDMQRTTLTSDTTTMTTQQLTGTTSLLNGCNIVTHQPSLLQPNPTIMPTMILNGNNSHIHDRDMSPGHHDNDSSLDETSGLDASTAHDTALSLSLSQLARKANHRHRRSSSSSLSKKKRGRPRLYERDPFTNKPIKSRPMPEGTELTLPTLSTTTATTLLMPGPATNTTFNTLHPHSNGCASLIFPNQSMSHTTTTHPTTNPSLLQQQTYSYPSLLNGNVSSTNMLSAPTLNIFSNATNHPSLPPGYSYTTPATTILPPASLPVPPPSSLSRPSIPPVTHTVENQATIPLKNLQISSTSSPMTSSPRPSTSTSVPSVVQLNPSPIKSYNQKSSNNDIVVHYIGGYVIRESSQPFPSEEHRPSTDDDPDERINDLNLSNGKEKENTSFTDTQSDLGSDQLRCLQCKKVDFSERFYNQEKRFCSRACSIKSSKVIKPANGNGKKLQHDRTPPIQEPTRVVENSLPLASIVDEQIPVSPDHGLPADPTKWTVNQVGEFVARLTNETIREAFYESEMDGQALLLMTQEHLRDTMKIKLGPSLIIASEITKLRERARTFSS